MTTTAPAAEQVLGDLLRSMQSLTTVMGELLRIRCYFWWERVQSRVGEDFAEFREMFLENYSLSQREMPVRCSFRAFVDPLRC